MSRTKYDRGFSGDKHTHGGIRRVNKTDTLWGFQQKAGLLHLNSAARNTEHLSGSKGLPVDKSARCSESRDHDAYGQPSLCLSLRQARNCLVLFHLSNSSEVHCGTDSNKVEVRTGARLSGCGGREDAKTQRDQQPRQREETWPKTPRSITWACLIPTVNDCIFWHQKETKKWVASRKIGKCGEELLPSPQVPTLFSSHTDPNHRALPHRKKKWWRSEQEAIHAPFLNTHPTVFSK